MAMPEVGDIRGWGCHRVGVPEVGVPEVGVP